MHDQELILRGPASAAQDQYASEPLHVVLGEKGQRRSRLGIGAFVFLIVAALGLVLWMLNTSTMKLEPGFWGMSMASVMFWLAVTQGMLAISALLRLAHASWRFPLTRVLDIASLFGIPAILFVLPILFMMRQVIYGPLSATGGTVIGAAGNLVPIHSYQKVWRMTPVSPFVIDCLFTITAYLAGFFLLWLTSRPDFAALRDRSEGGRQRSYRKLAAGWIGSSRQWRILRLCEGFLMVAVVMTFFAAQTIQGWDFQLAAGREWDSSIFPFQVNLGALFAGTAMLVLVMTALRGSLRGGSVIGEKQYDSIGKLMIALGLLFFYFRWCDFITAWYGHTPAEWTLQLGRTIRYPVAFTLMVFGCMIIPIFANIFGAVRKSPFLLSLISVFILIGVWCQRFLDSFPAFGYTSPGGMAMTPAAIFAGALVLVGLGGLFLLTYFLAIPLYSAMSWWGMSKWRTRSATRPMGNSSVTVMVEDPPVWEN